MIFFSVDIKNKYIGASDILNQLSVGYRLGKMMSFSYIHKPFTCRRSLPNSLTKLIERRLLSPSQEDDLFVAKTFGLANSGFQDSTLAEANLPTIIDIAKLLKNNPNSSIDDLKKEIQCSGNPLVSGYFCFLISDDIYAPDIRDKVKQFLRESSLEVDEVDLSDRDFKLFTSSCYWKSQKLKPINKIFDDNKINVLVHIRGGDRAWVELGEKTILMHGYDLLLLDRERSNSSNWQAHIPTVLSRKFSQKPISAERIGEILDKITEKYGVTDFSYTIISDGYWRTIKELTTAILGSRLSLSSSELIQLTQALVKQQLQLMMLARRPNTQLLIGENSKEKFAQSVHAMACADVIVKTTGGFTNLHRLLKKPGSLKVCFDATCTDEQSLTKFLEDLGHLQAEKAKLRDDFITKISAEDS